MFESGLNMVFPNIASADMPPLVVTVRQTPDAKEYWIAGLYGQVSRVSESEAVQEPSQKNKPTCQAR